jgi:hypothetical protein
MPYDMQKILDDLKDTRKFCYQTIMDTITDYIYREKRYATHFSIAVIYTDKPLSVDVATIASKLRRTDKMICITQNIICVIFDATENSSYVKATENFYKILKTIDYHKIYFISTALSEDFDENYLDMINKLFDRLDYSVEHRLCSSVNYEDYII